MGHSDIEGHQSSHTQDHEGLTLVDPSVTIQAETGNIRTIPSLRLCCYLHQLASSQR